MTSELRDGAAEELEGAVVAAFRRELAEWLADHLTGEVSDAAWGGLEGDTSLEVLRAWNRLLADAGWAAVSWPAELRRPRRRDRRAAGLARGDGARPGRPGR